VDGDGIAFRTVPGNRHPSSAWFARGTGHDEYARYSESSVEYQRNMERLSRKYETAREFVPKPELDTMPGAEVGIIAFGSTEPAVQEARNNLALGGLKTDFLRVKAVPFCKEVEEFIDNHDRIYVVEMNRDGQLHQLLRLDYWDKCVKMISLAYLDGLPLTARWIEDAIQAKEMN
jgi:2-oxoglutarate ferredoxin oxidoreductase subunit alpha